MSSLVNKAQPYLPLIVDIGVLHNESHDISAAKTIPFYVYIPAFRFFPLPFVAFAPRWFMRDENHEDSQHGRRWWFLKYKRRLERKRHVVLMEEASGFQNRSVIPPEARKTGLD